MKAVTKLSIIRWVGLVGMASTVALAGCSSPEGDAQRFCQSHRGGDLMVAWEQLSSKDQAEIKQRDYANFEWDQETFDLRLLRSHESCTATVKPLSETEALATLTLKTRMHEGTMSCTLPMVKEEGKWKMSRHWEPIEKLRSTIADARKELTKGQVSRAALEPEPWTAATDKALKTYWGAIDTQKKIVQASVGEEIPPFCYGPLNVDGGQDLAYRYLGFQKSSASDASAKPKHLIEKGQLHAKLLHTLRTGYKPITSLVHEGVHLDLMSAEAGDGSDGSVDKGEARALMVAWGELKSPIHWTLYVYIDGKLVNEGNGTPIDLVGDVSKVIADAPEVQMVIFEFPTMPAGTDKLELKLIADDEKHEFKVQIPVKPEYIKKG